MSSTVILNYIAGTGNSSYWSNISNAFDGVDDTYASNNTSSIEDAYLLGQTLANFSLSGTISKVEVGAECHTANTGYLCNLRPLFNGSVSGSSYSFTAPSSDTDTPIFVDITEDSAGPGNGNWKWTDIANLDVKLWGLSYKNITTGYVDRICAKVTYNPISIHPYPLGIPEKPFPGTPVQPTHPLIQGCRCFLPLNENAGGKISDSTSHESGDLSDASQWNVRPGWLHFDGSATRITFSTPKNLGFPVLTLLLHLRIDSLSDTTGGLWQVSDTAGNAQAYLRIMPDGTVFAAFNNDSTLYAQTSTTLFPGVDYLLAVSFDGNSNADGIRIFINGIEAAYASQSDADPSTDCDNWSLGMVELADNSSCFFNGSLFWTAWYHRILSISELKMFCQQPFLLFESSEPLNNITSSSMAAYHLIQLAGS